MTITILSAPEVGGAGGSAKNLEKGLINLGVKVSFLSEQKVINQKISLIANLRSWWLVRKHVKKNAAYLLNAPSVFDHFSFARTGYQNLHQQPLVKNADVLNLHWLSYLIDYPTFFKRLNKPMVFTLHDTNLFTGGCHYTFGCRKYEVDCEYCPQLAPEVRAYAAKNNLKIKMDSLMGLNPNKVAIISPSVWLKRMSEKSTLFKKFRHFHIPNGIDTNEFSMRDQSASRSQLGLPADKFIALFVGTNIAEHRKGFDIILKLQMAVNHTDDIAFVAIGNAHQQHNGITSLGFINNVDVMAAAYSAADVFIIPSRQDNLPNTMLEALCCGTPVIGFKTGGIIDAINHGENGFLVEQEDVADIVNHLTNMKNKTVVFDREKISKDAAERYSLEKQALAYSEVFSLVAATK